MNISQNLLTKGILNPYTLIAKGLMNSFITIVTDKGDSIQPNIKSFKKMMNQNLFSSSVSPPISGNVSPTYIPNTIVYASTSGNNVDYEYINNDDFVEDVYKISEKLKDDYIDHIVFNMPKKLLENKDIKIKAELMKERIEFELKERIKNNISILFHKID